MGVVARLPLLLFSVVLGKVPPFKAPGAPSGVPGEGPATAKCPECDEETDEQVGGYFVCANCGIWFDSDGIVQHPGAGS
jgi:hypothetical protein